MLVYTERLKEERKKKGFTYAYMAKQLGYKSRSTYRYIELGVTAPKLSIMTQIAFILGKPISYFFNLEVQETNTNPKAS
ncbi:helix-turn-helix transcriptional regulator [Acetobacterium wieringae]|uniref:helix-turn-helix transcriptional regulator n=1 Tax=Acetobacterium wieringae TaxID=52694 RepID=UPI002B21FA48|nr:helix-turn-helix transcriptional regulator [Acetobacterium wieringae]MEA4805135.1 helix-turn-helix transcriptional regulator [Acetobacterium wieringae]